MPFSFLFVINGLGLGNSTRCHAVMERLALAGCQIHVLTSGNGLEYFAGRPEVTSLESNPSFFYGRSGAGVSGWSTLGSLPRLAQIASEKRANLERWLDRMIPDVAVVDSEYVLSPLRRRSVPIVAINNAESVVTQYLKHCRRARGTRSQFCFVEFPDYLFHRRFCDLVLSPHPLDTPTRAGNFRRIGLILRRGVEDRARNARARPLALPQMVRRVVCMLSGSIHASQIDFGDGDLPFAVDVVGRTGTSRGNVTFHGRRMDNIPLLESADVLVINGGYSAVSEALAFGRPTLVVPVPGHAEQFVNARLVADLGFGFVATEQDVLMQLRELYRRNDWNGLNPRPASLCLNGAQQAAESILAMAKKSRERRNGTLEVSSAGLKPEL